MERDRNGSGILCSVFLLLEHRFLDVRCARRRSPKLARDTRAPPRPAPARSHSLDANPVLVATGLSRRHSFESLAVA